MSRTLAFVVAMTLFVGLVPVSASAEWAYDMVFPLIPDPGYSDNFGDLRSGGRTHEGIDIMSPKMTPIVAVADGTVGWMDDEQGGDCCAMELQHDDGFLRRAGIDPKTPSRPTLRPLAPHSDLWNPFWPILA